jgi:FkbM family methyltransferase
MDRIKKLAELIRKQDESLTFTMLEIGGVPLSNNPEPFHRLVDLFPGSQVYAFEVDKAQCDKLNESSKPGIKFYANALGQTEETRSFYETQHPMCSSLYEPNEKLLKLFTNFEVVHLKSVSQIETVSLDFFAKDKNIPPVDFIKIDIQGAELDVFKGAVNVLKDVVTIVSEVEFIPLYVNQPLFGDVCSYLSEQDLMFHKFLGLAGRTLSPITIDNNPNLATQHCWSDAVFIRDIFKVSDLTSVQLLKLSMLAFLYGSPDLTFHALQHFDKLMGAKSSTSFLNL